MNRPYSAGGSGCEVLHFCRLQVVPDGVAGWRSTGAPRFNAAATLPKARRLSELSVRLVNCMCLFVQSVQLKLQTPTPRNPTARSMAAPLPDFSPNSILRPSSPHVLLFPQGRIRRVSKMVQFSLSLSLSFFFLITLCQKLRKSWSCCAEGRRPIALLCCFVCSNSST